MMNDTVDVIFDNQILKSVCEIIFDHINDINKIGNQ